MARSSIERKSPRPSSQVPIWMAAARAHSLADKTPRVVVGRGFSHDTNSQKKCGFTVCGESRFLGGRSFSSDNKYIAFTGLQPLRKRFKRLSANCSATEVRSSNRHKRAGTLAGQSAL